MPNMSTMITKLCNYEYRSNFIIEIVKYELKKNINQQIMILSQNKSLIYYLQENLEKENIDVGLCRLFVKMESQNQIFK